jgi:hypothetical protein
METWKSHRQGCGQFLLKENAEENSATGVKMESSDRIPDELNQMKYKGNNHRLVEQGRQDRQIQMNDPPRFEDEIHDHKMGMEKKS